MICRCGHSEALHLHIRAGACGVLDCSCRWFEETTRKVEQPKAIALGVANEKCRHCHRRTEGRCTKCGAAVCAICMWPTRSDAKKEMDLCRPCRDSAVAAATHG